MSEILFADDDAAMRQMVADALQASQHHVRLASNGNAALQEVRRAAPDLVLLDYRMGEPNGFEVCRHIKADPRTSHLPVLLLTGENRMEDRLRGFDSGADDYLAKPFDMRELLARIRALLQLARHGLERNPTSRLPGGEAISREFDRRRASGRTFTICYLDLDHLKALNDRFGFSVTDLIIRDTGDVLHSLAEANDAFAGHVGGDDFVLICETDGARRLTEEAQARFRERLARRLPAEVVRAGHFRGTDREGLLRDLPLSRLSTAIVTVEPNHPVTLPELGELAAQGKRRAKQTSSGIEEVEPGR